MSYISLMNKFLIASHYLTNHEIVLYLRLFEIANYLQWPVDFELSNGRLLSITGIKKYETLNASRNRLMQFGLIDYKVTSAKHAGRYRFIDDDAQNGVPTGQLAGVPTGQLAGVPTGQLAGVPTGQLAGVPSKKEKERSKEKEKIYKDLEEDEREGAREDAPALPPSLSPASEKPKGKRKQPERKMYGEFRNVPFSDAEIAKLKARFPDSWADKIEQVSEWAASKGKTIKNGWATILNWERMDAKRRAQNASDSRASAANNSTAGGTDWSRFDNTYTQEDLDGGSDEAWAAYKRKYPSL